MFANKITANVDIIPLFNKKLIINAARLSDFELNLSKDSINSQLNIQYIIDAFKSENEESKDKLQVKVSAVSLINGNFSYNVKDKPKISKFDVNHIQVSDFNARLALKSLTIDSLNIQIKKLSLKEQSGLEISNLTTRVITQDKKTSIKGFRLDLPNSFLQFDRCEVDLSDVESSKDILDNATFDCIITPSYIAPKDISAIVPDLKNFDDLIKLEAHILGSIDNIDVSELTVSYGEKMHLVSNLEIKDIRDKDKLYLLGSIDKFTITGKEIEGLLNNFSNNNITLPSQVKELNSILFEGDISGYLNQLTAFGNLETELGIVKADVLFGFNKNEYIKSYLKGKIYTSDFEIGKLIKNNDFDKISLELNVQAEQPKFGKLRGTLDGNIHNVHYKNYAYSDVKLNINYSGLKVDGNINLNDENAYINIKGLFDLSDSKNPELNFTAQVENLRFEDLHLSEKLKQSSLSFVMRANFKGKNIDDADGYINIDSLDFIRESNRFQMDKFRIEASGIAANRQLRIRSDILNAEVLGAYSFSTITQSIQQSLQPYLPALIKELSPDKRKRIDKEENNLTFNIRISNTENLSNILQLPVTVINQAKIAGYYNNQNNKFKVEVFTPAIKAAGMNIRSGYILAENQDNKISSTIDAFLLGKNNVMNNVIVNSTATENQIDTKISFSNDGRTKARGDFSITTLFEKNKENPLLIDIDIKPSSLVLNDESWSMEKAHLIIQKDEIQIDNLYASNTKGDQAIKIDGKYSKSNPFNTLKAELKNIDLKYIFETLAIEVLRFGGSANGKLFVSSIDENPYVNIRLDVTDFQFNDTHLGHLNLYSELDDETKKVMMSGEIMSKESKKTAVNGFLDPINQKISLNFDADSLDISFLNTYAKSVFNNIRGRGTGNVHLFGNFSNVTVEGKAFVENGNIGINFLNTNYSFTDTIYMKSNLIYFNNINFIDQYNNIAKGNGKVVHDMFKNFVYYVEMDAQNFQVYNANERQNPIFSGRIFGSGKGSISGDEQVVDIDINMRTEKNTIVRMNFMDQGINEYNFITYKDNKSKIEDGKDSIKSIDPIKINSPMEVNMKVYIDATPDAVAEIVMDPVGGDILSGSGSGTLQFTWSTKSAPRIYGNYLINRGSYLFTFQRLLERKFSIEDGSSVQFSGDPFNAGLNVKAAYKVIANLNDLNSAIVQTSGQSNIPVNCILNLSGPLRHPNIRLDLEFPTAVPEVERQIKVLLNSEDMINRQVAYLLLLSKFYTPHNSENEYRTSDFASVASATLSNQLTKIVSQIDSRFQLGTNIRTSDAEMNSTEVELLLSSQLLNNRLLINGNFGYRDDPLTQTSNQFIGDVDIEYLLNSSGTWRVKAYNRYNEKYYYTLQAEQTQGVGIKYKRDFDRVMELLPWRPKKKTEENNDSIRMPIIPDSTRKGSPLSNFIKIKK